MLVLGRRPPLLRRHLLRSGTRGTVRNVCGKRARKCEVVPAVAGQRKRLGLSCISGGGRTGPVVGEERLG